MAPRNKAIVLLVKVSISAGLLYAVITKAGVGKIFSALRGMDVRFFALAVLIYLLALFISSIRWQLLLHEKSALPRLFSLYLIGSFFNHLLPGLIGGDAVKAYYLYRDTGKGTSAIASVFMDRYIGFSALMLLGLVAFPFGFHYFRGSYLAWVLPLMVICFITGSFILFGLRVGKGISFMSGFYDYFALYQGKRDIVIKTFAISLTVQVIVICAVYVLSRGLKVDVPFLSLFIFIPIITTIATIPISVSGIGVREASFVLLFGSLGISPVQATAVSFAWFLSVATGSLPGLIEYLRFKREEPKHSL